MKIVVILLLVLATFSCHKNQSTDDSEVSESEIKPEIQLASVSALNCLNVEKIMAHLQNSRFQFPAAIMTTDHRSMNEISISKDQYISYSNFYYKSGIPSELNLMSVAAQTECKAIQLYTASREILNFKITESSDQHIKFVLIDQFAQSLSGPKKRGLFKRLQPFEYDVIYQSDKSLKIIEKYKTFDPLCLTKNSLSFETTKIISWARVASELPDSYDIDLSFLNKVKSAIINGAGEMQSVLSVTEIKSLMQSPIREELKLCL